MCLYAVFKVHIPFLSKRSGDKGIRTLDPLLVRQVLSQLSYDPIMERVKGIEPSQLAWKARTLPVSYTRIIVFIGDS